MTNIRLFLPGQVRLRVRNILGRTSSHSGVVATQGYCLESVSDPSFCFVLDVILQNLYRAPHVWLVPPHLIHAIKHNQRK